MTTGPPKPFKYVPFRDFVHRWSALQFLCERRRTSLSGGIAGKCSTSTMRAAPSIAHPHGVPSGPSCSSGMAIAANSGSLAARSGPRSRTTSLSDGGVEAMVRKTSVPPALPATTSGTRRRAAALGDRGVKSLAVRGREPGGGEVLYGAELGGGGRRPNGTDRDGGGQAIRCPGSSPARPSPAAPPRSGADPSP